MRITSRVQWLSSKIDRALYCSSPSWDFPCCQDYQDSTLCVEFSQCHDSSGTHLDYPKKISTQTRGETSFTFLEPAHSDQDLKSVQTEIFFKIRRCKSGLFPFNQPKFRFSSYLLYLNIVLVSNYEIHWWVSGRRVRHETVCMDKRIKCCQNSFGWT